MRTMQTKTSQRQSAQGEQRAVQRQPHPAGQRRSSPLGNAGLLLSLQRSHGNRYVQRLLSTTVPHASEGPGTGGTQDARTESDRPDQQREYPRAATFIQAKFTVSEPGDPYEREADRVADEVMRMPGKEIDSPRPHLSVTGISRQSSELADLDGATEVQRRSAQADVSAAESVEAVLQRQGSPLDGALRDYFEPRFGRAFDNVRIHTDAQANKSARSINALAYTAGSHIVFGKGQYQPETFAGKRLIAHELTHAVQQGAATALTPSVQTFRPPAPVEGGVLPDTIGGSLVPHVQRLVIPAPGAGSGLSVGSDDDSSVEVLPRASYWVGGRNAGRVSFGSGQLAALPVGASTSGILMIAADLHFFLDNSLPWSNAEYDASFSVAWPVQVSPQGQLTIADANPVTYGPETAQNTQLVLSSVQVAKGDHHVVVTVNISSTTMTGRTGGVGYEYNVSAGGRGLTRDFRLNLLPPVMPPTVTVGPIRIHRTHSLQFEQPGRDNVSTGEEQRLITWYQSLNGVTRDKIQSGEEPVQLVGHASVPGGTQANRELSNRREQAVERILRQYVGSQAVFHTRAVGAYEAQQATEAIEERRVDVEVWETGDAPQSGSGP